MLVYDYIPIVVMMALSGAMVLVFTLGSVYLGPRSVHEKKLMPFECGHPSRGYQVKRFAVKFYGIAVLFILFDIEAVFFYPWAVVFGELKLYALVEMVIFLGVLFLALAYVWSKGGLEWD